MPLVVWVLIAVLRLAGCVEPGYAGVASRGPLGIPGALVMTSCGRLVFVVATPPGRWASISGLRRIGIRGYAKVLTRAFIPMVAASTTRPV